MDNDRKSRLYETKESLLKSIADIEEKFKERELVAIEIVSISVSKVPSVHKFVKNTPWINCSVLDNKWKTDVIVSSGDGTSADWQDLNWSFVLPRNESERTDLVVVVCSQDVIIGRYILLASEFSKIPDTEGGYFEISGDILNSMGKAGKISITCKKEAAKRPGRAEIIDDEEVYHQIGLKFLPNHSAIDVDPQGMNSSSIQKHIDKLFVKFGSITVADLPSMHSFELNSPQVLISKGKWSKATTVNVGGGSSAKWTKLRWKVVVVKGDILDFEVRSGSLSIGNAYVSFDDLISNYTHGKVILDFVRHFNNGVNNVGKMKVKVQVFGVATEVIESERSTPKHYYKPGDDGNEMENDNNYDDDDDNDALNYTNDRGNMLSDNTLRNRSPTNLGIALNHSSLNSRPSSPSILKSSTNLNDTINTEEDNVHIRIKSKTKPHLRITTEENSTELDSSLAIPSTSNLNVENEGLQMIPRPVSPPKTPHRTPKKKPVKIIFNDPAQRQVKIEGLPFRLSILTLSAIDLKAKHHLLPNSPYITVACGSWGAATEVLHDAGQSAQWMNLSWKFVVSSDNQFLRFTIRSRDTDIGSCSLSVTELLKQPMDFEGYAEFFLRIFDTKGFITGKLKILVKYDQIEQSIKQSKSNFGFHSSLELPLLATIQTISVLDLKSVHYFRHNQPQVKIICDRKSALTKVGDDIHGMLNGTSARWSQLNWQLPIYSGSFLMIAVLSRDLVIGRLEIPAQWLVQTPLASDGVTEVSKYIVDDEGHATGKIHIVFQLSPLDKKFDMEQNPLSKMFRSDSPTRKMLGGEPPTPPKLIHVNDKDINFADLKTRCLSLHVRVLDIDVYELKSVHSFAKNSPFVNLVCGKYMEYSKEILHGGNSGYWSQLNWGFKLKADSSVRLTVGSGDKVIGVATLLPEAILRVPGDAHGHYRIVETLFDGMKPSGKIKLTYEMEVLRDRREFQQRLRKYSASSLPGEDPSELLKNLGKSASLSGGLEFHRKSGFRPISATRKSSIGRKNSLDDEEGRMHDSMLQKSGLNPMSKEDRDDVDDDEEDPLDFTLGVEDLEEAELTFPMMLTVHRMTLSDIELVESTMLGVFFPLGNMFFAKSDGAGNEGEKSSGRRSSFGNLLWNGWLGSSSQQNQHQQTNTNTNHQQRKKSSHIRLKPQAKSSFYAANMEDQEARRSPDEHIVDIGEEESHGVDLSRTEGKEKPDASHEGIQDVESSNPPVKVIRIRVECGRTSFITNGLSVGKDTYFWDQLYSSVAVESPHSELTITVFIPASKSSILANEDNFDRIIGSTVISGEDLADIPRNNVGISEITKSISNGKHCTGTLTILAKLESEVVGFQHALSINTPQLYANDQQPTLITASNAKGVFGTVETATPDVHLSYPLRPLGQVTFKRIDAAPICAKRPDQSAVMTSPRTAAVTSPPRINMENSVAGSEDMMQISDSDHQLQRQQQQQQAIPDNENNTINKRPNYYDSMKPFGEEQTTASIGFGGSVMSTVDAEDSKIAQGNEMNSASSNKGTTNNNSSNSNSNHNNVNRSSILKLQNVNKSPLDLLPSQEEGYLNGYRIKINKISCINLKQMHKMVANSPMATIICGNSLGTTDIVSNAGSSVVWEKQDMSFILHVAIPFRIIISSKSKMIGAVSWSLQELLAKEKSNRSNPQAGNASSLRLKYLPEESELLTIFGELSDDIGVSGNIKMSYRLQSIS